MSRYGIVKTFFFSILALGSLSSLWTAASAQTTGVAPSSGTPAEIAIVGTGDGIDLLRALGSAFSEQNRLVRIDVPPSIGSGGGIAAVGAGKAVLGRVARQLSAAEQASGIVYKPIARLPSAIFTHASVGIASITTAQLVDIYSGRLTNWNQVGGPDLRIRVVRREDNDSTTIMLRAYMPGWKDLVITDRSKMTTTTLETVETVRDVAGAIGFGPYSKLLEPDVKVLKIDGRFPTDAGYPSSVEFALIYTESTISAEARAFVAFTGTKKAGELMSRLGSVPVAQ